MIYLCVGGPKDGERVALHYHDPSVVVEFPVFTASKVERAVYAYRKLNVCGVNFLVPADDDSPVKMMMRLAEAYRLENDVRKRRYR